MIAAATAWHDRVLAYRDRLLADTRFQRWASRFRLTQPVARRRTRALFDLCAGFVYSQVLLACVQLRLFDLLAERPQTASALAPQLDLSEQAAARLLAAAASLQLLEKRSAGRFGLGPLGVAMLGNPGIGAMVEHHRLLYMDIRDPVALLRGDIGSRAMAAYWPYAEAASPSALKADDVARYSALMAASQSLVADEILDAYNLSRHRCLLDVGGGEGAFATRAAERHPHLRLMLFDLPPVAERATASFARSGLAGRAEAKGGDFRADPLPNGADVASLVRVIHDHNDDSALIILRAVRQALPPGGKLLLAEPMSETSGAEPSGAAYFGFYLLAVGSGKPRNPAQLKALLAAAGFSDMRLLPTSTPLLVRVMAANVNLS